MGDLDPHFGSAGRVTITGNSGPHVFELPDGRIIVAGRAMPASDGIALVATSRYLPDGAPDLDYGVGGRATAALPRGDTFSVDAAALQQDGRLAFVGSYRIAHSGPVPYASRIDEQGALDSTFAGGLSGPDDGATEPWYASMLVMPSGEILAAISDWTNDRIDRFGTDGRYLGSLTGRIGPHQLALQQDGRLIVSGYHRDLHQNVVMRVDAAGQLDRTFGAGGFAVLSTGHDDVLAVDPGSDRILICNRQGITRLSRDGQLDMEFGPTGTGSVTFGSDGVPSVGRCTGLIPMLDGGVAYVATRSDPTGGSDEVLVGGLTETGAVDTRFGGGSGVRPIELGPVSATYDYWPPASRLMVTRDGNVLLTWWNSTDSTLQLARLDLGGYAAYADPPATSAPNPPQPPEAGTPPPTSTPSPTPTPDADRQGGGGGGSTDTGDLVLLGLIAWTAFGRRRLHWPDSRASRI